MVYEKKTESNQNLIHRYVNYMRKKYSKMYVKIHYIGRWLANDVLEC